MKQILWALPFVALLMVSCTPDSGNPVLQIENNIENYKKQKYETAQSCENLLIKMVDLAKGKKVTAPQFSEFKLQFQYFGCGEFIPTNDIFTQPQSVALDYINANSVFSSQRILPRHLNIWFSHELKTFPDPSDSNISHEFWTTWKAPKIELRIFPNGRLTYDYAEVVNYPFVNPIERVKMEGPSLSIDLMGGSLSAINIQLNIQDANVYAKTWVADVYFLAPTQARIEILNYIDSVNTAMIQKVTSMEGQPNDSAGYETIRSYVKDVLLQINKL